MTFTKFRAIFAVCLVLPVVSGCSDDKATRFALSDTGTFKQNQGTLSDSFTAGDVTGGTVPLLNPFGVSSDEYKDALTLSLRANHLLAETPQTARYRIDVTIDFDRSGIFDKEIDANIDYRLLSNATSDLLFETKIQSTASTNSVLKEKAGVVVALLFTNRNDNNAAWQATYFAAARNNLTQFFDALSKWTPPAKTQSPVTETKPRHFEVPTAAFQRLSSDRPL